MSYVRRNSNGVHPGLSRNASRMVATKVSTGRGDIDDKKRRKILAIASSALTITAIFAAFMMLPVGVSALTPHAPITITSDADFPINATSGVIWGTGTSSDPYIIDGWSIDGTSQNGISISGTTAYFVIRNVSIYRIASSVNYHGISFSNLANGTIEDVNITGNFSRCISLDLWVNNINISGNEMVSPSHPAQQYGIYMYLATDIEISDNNITMTTDTGIGALYSTRINFSGNKFHNCGLNIWGAALANFNTHSITTDNTVNGKPIYYYRNATAPTIDGISIGQLILTNCTDIYVANLQFNDTDTFIAMSYVSGGTVEDNTGVNFSWYGIIANYVDNVTIDDNSFTNGGFGAYISYSADLTLSSNTIKTQRSYGVYSYYSARLNLTGNNISDATNYGVYLQIVTDSNLTLNFFCDNGYGVVLASCTGVHVYHNNFFDSMVSNAIDNNGPENYWDDGYPSGGNFWDNYTGVDGNMDGIGDTPYVIDADSADNYPLMEPIPEFSDILVPIIALAMITLAIARKRKPE